MSAPPGYAQASHRAPILRGNLGWQERANCQGAAPETFFPAVGHSNAEAKAICRRCPVKAECLTEALRHGEHYGIFGGLSEAERRELRGRR